VAAFVCGDEEAAMMYWSLKLHEFPDSPSCCAKEKFGDLKGCKPQKDRLYNGQMKKDKQRSSSNICSTRCTCRVPVKQQTSCDMEIMLDTSI
jgi:hypothetical protein